MIIPRYFLPKPNPNRYIRTMTSFRILAPALAALALASCASQKADPYDTANPYGTADAGLAQEPANPVYDTPAAYEEGGANASASSYAPAPSASNVPIPPAPAPAPAHTGNGSAIIHTVVAGDTLSGLSSKYKVPVAAIKQANRMTNDVVVLGRKMVIPPAR